MDDEYHQLGDVIELHRPEELVIPRAQGVFRAVEANHDYSIVHLLKSGANASSKFEHIVVDVEVDGVPPKNPYGINYRERLALCVPANPKQLVRVFALRKSFPVLIHQDQGDPGESASLCLYFEHPAAVLRTWTPQSFLRRIQWWLEKSAIGELHPADQPVEDLFFSSKYDLVLPSNFEESLRDTTRQFVIRPSILRPDQGFTCFVETIAKGAQPEFTRMAHIRLTLPPIVHGFVERHPQTLGQLADLMEDRGVEIMPMLQDELRVRVGDDGISEDDAKKFVVVILHVPICRIPKSPPERTSHRAFLIPASPKTLAVATGAMFELDGKLFSAEGVLDKDPPVQWRSQQIVPMDILRMNSPATARAQSGIKDAGPIGVLVGAGSLGSAMLNLWGRSGWGHWSVIDSDHVKPHNLSRHVGYSQHIGETKVSAVAHLHEAAMPGASQVVPVFGDAANHKRAPVATAMSTAELVVDASTTLEYPRYASTDNSAARHISVFVTPNGNSSVLLVEDEERLTRLRTLEAQYYRAIIQSAWGKGHLDNNANSFWSGASCRDISFVTSYSRIIGHASTLAEQIPRAADSAEAEIRIWERDSVLGRVKVHDVAVHPERCLNFAAGLDLFIDDGAESELRALRSDNLPNETGGILLGYYDFNVGAVVVVAGLPAPADSKSDVDSFERGVEGLIGAVNDASRRTAGVVGYVGEWHSHPAGHSADPSPKDLVQLIHLALGMADDGLPAVQLIVGDSEVQIIQGSVK